MNKRGGRVEPDRLGGIPERGIADFGREREIIGQSRDLSRLDIVAEVVVLGSGRVIAVEEDEGAVRRPSPRAERPVFGPNQCDIAGCDIDQAELLVHAVAVEHLRRDRPAIGRPLGIGMVHQRGGQLAGSATRDVHYHDLETGVIQQATIVLLVIESAKGANLWRGVGIDWRFVRIVRIDRERIGQRAAVGSPRERQRGRCVARDLTRLATASREHTHNVWFVAFLARHVGDGRSIWRPRLPAVGTTAECELPGIVTAGRDAPEVAGRLPRNRVHLGERVDDTGAVWRDGGTSRRSHASDKPLWREARRSAGDGHVAQAFPCGPLE